MATTPDGTENNDGTETPTQENAECQTQTEVTQPEPPAPKNQPSPRSSLKAAAKTVKAALAETNGKLDRLLSSTGTQGRQSSDAPGPTPKPEAQTPPPNSSEPQKPPEGEGVQPVAETVKAVKGGRQSRRWI